VVALSVVSGNTQRAPVNTKLPNALRIRVLNPSGQPVPNFVVNFVVTSGGGHVFGGAEETNAEGYAEEQWTLGPRLGTNTLEVRTVNPSSGVAASYGNFTAIAGPPNTIPVVLNNSKGIARMNADGSDVVQLTTDARDSLPDLSPDHTKIVFVSSRSGTGQAIYLMNADGNHIHPITGIVPFAGGPSFSPNGAMLVFLFDQFANGVFQTAVEVTDTSGNILGGWLHQETLDIGVSWSADGQVIVYGSDFSGGGIDIYKSDIAAKSQVQLTLGWCAYATAESPDGQHIAFIGGPVSASSGCAGTLAPNKVFLMDLDGSNITAITGVGATGTPTWSPDSQLIGIDQGLMNADGTDLVKINGGAEGRFAWR
jgi:Tol biopolymer transport system component